MRSQHHTDQREPIGVTVLRLLSTSGTLDQAQVISRVLQSMYGAHMGPNAVMLPSPLRG